MKRLIVVLVLASWRGRAQPSNFEVASVRLAASESDGVRTSPDSLTLLGVSLQDCIQAAYRMPPTQIDGPAWLRDVRLDIVAKAGGPVEERQLFVMLRTLLAERLGVKVHIEQREQRVYALTLGKGGPKFSESKTEGSPSARAQGGVWLYEGFSMNDLAAALSLEFGRPVVDATGLKGRYDLRMDSTPYTAATAAGGNKVGPTDITGMLILALREQLGLKVESRKGRVDVLVVDHAEKKPVDN